MSKLNADVSSPEMSESSPSNEPTSPPASPDTKYPMSERISPLNQPDSPFSAVLQSRALWRQFSAVRTEMIVTRRGRRMFPPIKVELFNLEPSKPYVLLIDMSPVDKYRYKYQNSAWVKCFEEECSPTRLYIHPDSPALGSHWMNTVVSFYKLKLTNNQLDKQGHIIVSSMHNYQPRLHLVESADISNLSWERFNTFVFPETQFITVTAYQNDKITQLKIDNNPFAKGFRSPFSRCRTRHNSNQRCTLPSTSDSGADESNPPLTTAPQDLVFNTSPDQKGISGLKRTLQYEEHEHASNWSKHARQSPQVSSEGGNITNLSFAAHPQLITMPAQGIQSTLSGGQMGRFLILYSIPPTSHLPQFPNGTLLQQSSLLSGTTVDPQQLNISGPQIVQAAPTNRSELRHHGATLPGAGESPAPPAGRGNSVAHNRELGLLQRHESLESPSAKVSTTTSPAAGSCSSTPGNSMTMETADSDKIRHLPRPPPPPPPLLQLNPQVRVSSLADGTKVSVLSPPLPAQSSLSGPIIQSQMPNCIQRLVILGDMGKSQGATTMLVPAPGDQDQGKAYGATHMMYDPHQMVSSIPLYRFGSSHPIQILTPVGASVKKS
eukprot:Em0015g126a